ncbi:MAG: hypothetical protein JOY60_02510 [Burkholderiaceae bacterium]|nr:hypothetical protein [Roseateles sp.]MBV8468725.1 hypothetical protein [Burkholderiaceae bacterium]
MNAAQVIRSSVLTLVVTLFTNACMAAPQALSDEELRDTNGGQANTALSLANAEAMVPFLGMLALATEGANASTLTPAEFMAAIKALGINSLPTSLYNGQAVTESTLTAGKTTIDTNLSSMVGAVAGVNTAGVGSMGTVIIASMEAGNTKLFVWNH